jgi:hypothetical protein
VVVTAPTARPAAPPVAEWGKDHWSTLAYAETCCVDNGHGGVGRLSIVRMRCDADRHPLLAHSGSRGKFPTRLKGGVGLADHDDWDCLEDAERAGYCTVLSLVNGFVQLTPRGEKVCAALRAHKARGGNFADFAPPKRLLPRAS